MKVSIFSVRSGVQNSNKYYLYFADIDIADGELPNAIRVKDAQGIERVCFRDTFAENVPEIKADTQGKPIFTYERNSEEKKNKNNFVFLGNHSDTADGVDDAKKDSGTTDTDTGSNEQHFKNRLKLGEQ